MRQLDRQINFMFYERTALSKNKTAVLKKGAMTKIRIHFEPDHFPHFLHANPLS